MMGNSTRVRKGPCVGLKKSNVNRMWYRPPEDTGGKERRRHDQGVWVHHVVLPASLLAMGAKARQGGLGLYPRDRKTVLYMCGAPVNFDV